MVIKDVQNLGTEKDMRDRQLLARHDDRDRLDKIQSARGLIYEQNFAINTPQVEALLKPESLVPTSVRVSDVRLLPFCCKCCRAERIFRQAVPSRIQSLRNAGGRPPP